MSIEDEIQTIPTLKERAKAAIAEADERKAQANRGIYDMLRMEMYVFLVNKLQVDQGTATVAIENASETTKSISKSKLAPGEPDENLAIRVVVDKLLIRGHFVPVKVFGGQSSGGNKEFKGEDVYEDEFRAEWQTPNGAIHPIEDLASLGKLLREHLR